MFTRVLSSGLLALLAWIPAARSQAWVQPAELRERVVSAATALEDLADSPSRVVGLATAHARVAPHRRSGAPQGGASRNSGGVQRAFAAGCVATNPLATLRA